MMRRYIFIVVLILLCINVTFFSISAGESNNNVICLDYSVKKEKKHNIIFPIRSGFAEYFKSQKGKDLLFIVLYPYEIAPENWREISRYRKEDPHNFVVIKMEIRGAFPIGPGIYPTKSAYTDTDGKKKHFIPTLLTARGDYYGTTGTGVVTITKMNRKVGGLVCGYIYYQDDDFSFSGPFQARFLSDH